MDTSQKIQLTDRQSHQFEIIMMRSILCQLRNERMLTDAQLISALNKLSNQTMT